MNKLKTILIKNKPYVMVKDKVQAFNTDNPNGAILTEVVKETPEWILFKAVAIPDLKNPERRFVGHSRAYSDGSQMGGVAVEVAETSAIGRCLSAMGYGILESYASGDEIVKASGFGKRADTMTANPISPKQKQLIIDLLTQKGTDVTDPKVIDALNKMNSWQASQKIGELKGTTFTKSNAKAKAMDDVERDIDIENQVIIQDEQ